MDKYDAAIRYLQDYEDEIYNAWRNPYNHLAGCLFEVASSQSSLSSNPDIGCLTMIKDGNYCAETADLTARIMEDDRIPDNVRNINVDNLHVFAEWQRILDKELNRC